MAGELKNIEQGNYNILIEEGGNFFLAVLGEGEDVKMVRENMRKIVERINNHYGAIISQWQGDMKDFYGIGKLFWDLTS